MKKIFGILFVMGILFFASCAFAADVTGYVPNKIVVSFEKEFSSLNVSQNIITVVVNDNYKFSDDMYVEKGTRLYLTITKVNKENVGKIDANVEAKIIKVYVPSKNKTLIVKNPNAIVKLSRYEKLDIADKSIDAGISVTNYFVKNITYPAHFVKGAVKNEQGNILKSGFQETYDSSVLSYVSKGKPFIVSQGELATLTFYTKNINKHTRDTMLEEEKPSIQQEDKQEYNE